MIEIWAPVPYERFDKVYEISNKGRVRSKRRFIMVYPENMRAYKREVPEKIMSIRTNGTDGIMYTDLTVSDIEGVMHRKTLYPHKAVAEVFLAHTKKPHHTLVMHKSNNYADNSIRNVYWADISHNVVTSMANNKYRRNGIKRYNEASGYYKSIRTKPNKIARIIKLHAQGVIAKVIADKVGVGIGVVYRYRND